MVFDPKGQSADPMRDVTTFDLPMSARLMSRLDELAVRFVSAVLKMSHKLIKGHPAFPGLDALGLAKEHIALMQKKPPQRPEDVLMLGRLDMSTDGSTFITYELNGDQPGGMEYVALVGKTREPRTAPHTAYFSNALDLFRRTQGREPEGVLLLSNGYHLIDVLSGALREFFGDSVLVAEDGGGCRFDGGRLLAADDKGLLRPVDLVFRSPRVNVYELVSERYAPIRLAWEQERMVLVNPPHSRVAGCKAIYALLAREELLSAAGVDEAEALAVRTILPRVLFVNQSVREMLMEERSRWVLKAPLGGKGVGITIGAEIEPELWSKRLEEALTGQGWTAQSFRPPFDLQIRLEDRPGRVKVPASIDPFVTVGHKNTVCGYLSRAVIPKTDDPAELWNPKLNILGQNLYTGSDGTTRKRTVGVGRVVRAS